MSEVNETTVIADEAPARNPAVLALAVVGALLVGVLVWYFVAAPLLGGADPDVVASEASNVEAEDTVASEPDGLDETIEAADASTLPVVTYEVFLERDPFERVVPELASTASAPDPAAGEGTTDTGGGTTTGDGTTSEPGTTPDDPVPPGSTDGSGDGGDAGGASGCTTGEDVVCDGRVVSLVDIRSDDAGELLAVIQVDSTLYEASAGDVFAGSFLVQSLSDDRIMLLYGDDAFELREGDRILK